MKKLNAFGLLADFRRTYPALDAFAKEHPQVSKILCDALEKYPHLAKTFPEFFEHAPDVFRIFMERSVTPPLDLIVSGGSHCDYEGKLHDFTEYNSWGRRKGGPYPARFTTIAFLLKDGSPLEVAKKSESFKHGEMTTGEEATVTIDCHDSINMNQPRIHIEKFYDQKGGLRLITRKDYEPEKIERHEFKNGKAMRSTIRNGYDLAIKEGCRVKVTDYSEGQPSIVTEYANLEQGPKKMQSKTYLPVQRHMTM